MKRICAVLAAVLLLPTLAHARAYSGGGAGSVYGLPGLVARYDASVGSSITIATGVSQWNDLTGNGNNLLQATGAAQPTLSGGGILFNGTSQLMRASFTLVQPETVYFVGQQQVWTANHGIWDGFVNAGMNFAQSSSTPNVTAYAGSVVGLNPGWPLSTTSVVSAGYYGATVSFDRVNQSAAVTGSSGAGNGSGFTIGAQGNATTFTKILVFEVLIFNTAHNTATQNQIISFLEAKWGLPQI